MRFVMIMMVVLSSITISHSQDWLWLEDGVEGTVINKNIWVFKFHQQQISFKVKGSNLNRKTLPELSKGNIGGINLNMFTGNLPNGYTKINGKVIQPNIVNYNAFIVWNRDTLRIMDRTTESMKEIMSYPNVSQNIRMAKEDGKRNRWQIDDKKWSVSAIGTTTDGKVLFFHSRAPYQMHEFIDVLLKDKGLDLYRLAYTEGGSESGVVLTGLFTNPLPHSRMGSYETGVSEHNDNTSWYGLPWALVVYLK